MTAVTSVIGLARRDAEQVQEPLHLLVNHARVLATPHQSTADELELQLATNYSGPPALTRLQLLQLVASGDARVVAISSQMGRVTRRPRSTTCAPTARHHGVGAYSRSKPADLMLVLKLDQRARTRCLRVKGLAAHLGSSATGLLGAGLGTDNRTGTPCRATRLLPSVLDKLGQPTELGAPQTVVAATADLPGSSCIGPKRRQQRKGHPRIVKPPPRALDRVDQWQLRQLDERTTGVRFLT